MLSQPNPSTQPAAGTAPTIPERPAAGAFQEPGRLFAGFVPDYELLRRIGGGAYGEVWLARSKATGAFRAAKIVWRHRFEDERPFQREFEGIQRFERISREHPSQLALFHIGRNDAEGYFYYVMELADDWAKRGDGGLECGCDATRQRLQDSITPPLQDPTGYVPHTLRADLAQGRLPAARVLEIGLALAEALSHLHAHGLVHRDVKPSNVIFVNGRPKLADIGLVTDASDKCSLVGTEGYLPPEGPGTPQADIFALGKVLYEAATGLDRRRFPDLPPQVAEWPDATSVLELNQVVLKACAAKPQERYRSAEEMKDDLARLAVGKSVLRAHRAARRWRLVRGSAAWVTASVAVMAAGALLLTRSIRPEAGPARPESRSTNDIANQLYALGKLNFDKFKSTNMETAERCFQDASRADTNFAPAYGYLAATYFWCSSDGWNPDWKYLDKAKQEARKALDLDKTLAEPYLALGWHHALREWAWREAEHEYRQAIQLNPRSYFCHLCYAEFLRVAGRMTDALVEINKAKELDESSFIINYRLASYFVDARQFSNALAQVGRLKVMEPTRDVSSVEINVLTACGRYLEAIDCWRKSQAAAGKSEDWLKEHVDPLRAAVEFGGANAYWSKRLDFMKNDIYGRACCYAQLHDTNAALNTLSNALSRTNVWLTFHVMTDWTLDPVRSDPRFHEILKTMRLQ